MLVKHVWCRREKHSSEIFCCGVGNFTDMCVKCEVPYPKAAVLFYLCSVVIPGNEFLKSFAGLL